MIPLTNRRRLSRRTLLRGGAGVAIALPFLEAMAPRGARAQGVNPKRLILYIQPLSIYAGLFFPTAPNGPVFTKETQLPKNYYSGEGFMDNPNFELPYLLQSRDGYAGRAPASGFEELRQDLIILEGLQNSRSNHDGYSVILTGTEDETYPDLISLDQLLAREIGGQTKFPSLQISVANNGSDQKEAVSWTGPSQAAPATKSPSVLWNRLFSDVRDDPAAAEQLRAEHKSVLDAALSQAQSLSEQLGSTDRQKLEQYLTAFRSLEIQLSKAGPIGCNPPPLPDVDEEIDHHGGHENIPIHSELQLSMLAMAMACDLTRVATYQLANEANNYTFPWLNFGTRWHDMSHYKEGDPTGYIDVSQWSMDQAAFLARKLKELGAYDNTLIAFLVPMDHGGHHSSRNLPLLLVGNLDNQLNTGRHIRLDYSNGHRFTNDLLVSLAHAMGVPVSSVGEPDKNAGVIEELFA